MKDNAFFDTNIIVYLFDKNDNNKRLISQKIFEEYFKEKKGFISTQVLSEFFFITTTKLKLLTYEKAKEIVSDLSKTNLIVIYDTTIIKAIDIAIKNKLSYWDSLIISSAIIANTQILFTEDLNHGQIIDGVKIVNPYI